MMMLSPKGTGWFIRLEAGGWGEGQRIGFGQKPAMVIIDVNYNFVGDKPEPILESVKRFPYSCGEEGWEAVHQIASILPLAREKRIPIIYSIPDIGPKPQGWLYAKTPRAAEVSTVPANNAIVREIAPTKNDIVIHKTRTSIFFGTPLLSMLNALSVDTLLMCGCTTSGCVRASVMDAMCYNFKVSVIEEGTFDFWQMSHRVGLFEMNTKYVDVVPIAEVVEYLRGL